MKRLILTSTLALFTCLNAPAPTYTIPIAANTADLLGSQFAVGDTLGTEWSEVPDALAFFWNGVCTAFTFDDVDLVWYPSDPPVPLMTAFFYKSPFAGSIVRSVTPLSAPPGTFDLPAANQFFPRSNWHPADAQYSDLVGGSSVLNNRTFVWHWAPTTHTFDSVYRYTTALHQWQELAFPSTLSPNIAPIIPQYYGAFVGYFTPTVPAPALAPVQVLAGACPPNVTLTLTFSQPLDPIAAANPASYKIATASPGCALAGTGLGGQVQSVSVQWALAGIDCGPPSVTTVVLNVKLLTQSCNQYFVQPTSLLRSLGGTPATGSQPFTPFCTLPPPNDEPYQAIPLVSGVPAYGSLTCADATPAGTLLWVPPNSAVDAKDVWYSFTPVDDGAITVTTCQPLAGGNPCPNNTDTGLSVYTGNPGTALQAGGLNEVSLVINQQDIQAGGTFASVVVPPCTLNPLAAFIKTAVHACTTYYIRVAGISTLGAALPGDFAVLLTYTPISPNPNSTCLNAVPVSANSSTPFTVPAAGDAWFKFQAPPGSGATTWLTEVEACQAFAGAVVTVTKGPACPGTTVTGSAMACSATASFTFPADHDAFYFIHISNPTASTGCGFLQVDSGIPLGGTPGLGTLCTPYYRIVGAPTGVAWSWSLSAPPSLSCPSGFFLTGTAGPVSSALHGIDIAYEFASKINQAAGANIATVIPVPNLINGADLEICTACPASSVVLKVGSIASGPTCWVQHLSLPVAFGPCNFNPDIYALGDPDNAEADCNGNGQPDYLDILFGTSADVNGDGIPDECQGCIGVALDSGPDSTIGNLGGTATLAVHAVGSGPFSYQWRKDGNPVPGETNASLVLNNLPLEAAGLYDALVTNTCGQITSPGAVLFVDPQPVLTVAQAGTNVMLSWSAADYHLQANPALNNGTNWTDLPGDSPVTVPIGAQVRYFRLLQEP